MKLNKAQFDIVNEARIVQQLTEKQIEYKNSKRKVMTSVALHEESVSRGKLLLDDIDVKIKSLLAEKQKDRISLYDIDLEFQYLTEELVKFKEQSRKKLEEEKQARDRIKEAVYNDDSSMVTEEINNSIHLF